MANANADAAAADAAADADDATESEVGVPSVDAPTADVSTVEARELLADLVATPSPSGEEAAAAERLAAFFRSHDREVWIDDVGNVRAPADDSVLLTSHVDTVPGDVPVCLTDADANLTDAETVVTDAAGDDATLPTDGTAATPGRPPQRVAPTLGCWHRRRHRFRRPRLRPRRRRRRGRRSRGTPPPRRGTR